MKKKYNYSDITIIMVAYFPNIKMLNNLIKLLPNNIKIIIIQNCNCDLENILKFKKNLKIIKTKENLGNGSGINIGFKNTYTRFCLYLDIDILLENNFFKKILKKLNSINNFSILIPNINNKYSSKKLIETYETEGSVMLFNLKDFKKNFKFDEKFFLYYEEIDIFYRCKISNKKIYVDPTLFAKHKRASSIKIKYYDYNIVYLRAWHLMWSKFYFYKKNFNYFSAIQNTFVELTKDLAMIIVFIFKFDKHNFYIRLYRISGLLCSYISVSSYLRFNK
jgi:GT2 family glycosyltransferase